MTVDDKEFGRLVEHVVNLDGRIEKMDKKLDTVLTAYNEQQGAKACLEPLRSAFIQKGVTLLYVLLGAGILYALTNWHNAASAIPKVGG